MTFLWILLAIVYVACWIYFGLATFRKGHYWMFWIGFFLPFLWIIGAFIAPTERAAARAAGWRLGARSRRHRVKDWRAYDDDHFQARAARGERIKKGATVAVPHLSVAERVARGKAARAEVPRSSHATSSLADRVDPVELLERQAETRVPELVPIRYGRMLVSPFTFYRGAAMIMARISRRRRGRG